MSYCNCCTRDNVELKKDPIDCDMCGDTPYGDSVCVECAGDHCNEYDQTICDSCYEQQCLYNKWIELHENQINECLNNPNATAAGFHWCTDLSIFDGIELIVPSKA